MKNISLTKLSNLVKTNRDKLNITQKTLCDLTGINRAMISKIETGDYTPSIEQIEALGNALNFEYSDLFEEEVKDGDVHFNYRLMNGRATTRNAIKLLSAFGYDEDIIKGAGRRADEFLQTGQWK